jgi:hypothetical protein
MAALIACGVVARALRPFGLVCADAHLPAILRIGNSGGYPGAEALELRIRTSSIRRIAVVGAVKACQRDPESHGMGVLERNPADDTTGALPCGDTTQRPCRCGTWTPTHLRRGPRNDRSTDSRSCTQVVEKPFAWQELADALVAGVHQHGVKQKGQEIEGGSMQSWSKGEAHRRRKSCCTLPESYTQIAMSCLVN